jgi:hypothetical protein
MYSVFTGGFVNSHVSKEAGETTSLIFSFSSYKNGWKFGRGVRPSGETVVSSLLVENFFRILGVRKTSAFLNDDGSIMVTAYRDAGREHIEVTSDKAKNYRLVGEVNDNVAYEIETESILELYGNIWECVEKWGSARADCKGRKMITIEEDIKNLLYKFAPTHKHLKTKHDVTVIAYGHMQTSVPIPDMTRVAIYLHDGNWWVRPVSEFNDGRFGNLK